jgi:alkylated DNA repair dioxygenase AlkB
MDHATFKSKIYHLPKHLYTVSLGEELIMANYQSYFDQLVWKDIEHRNVIAFKTCWMVKAGCSCIYRYGKQAIVPTLFDETMLKLTKVISNLAGFDDDYFNSCNLNAYLEERAYVEWHSDNEPIFRQSEFKRDVDIVSLSMGGTRNFMFRKKMGELAKEVKLEDGDLCYMGGRLQDHFLHHIPQWTAEKCGPFAPRVNLTWRVIKRHGKECPLRVPAALAAAQPSL